MIKAARCADPRRQVARGYILPTCLRIRSTQLPVRPVEDMRNHTCAQAFSPGPAAPPKVAVLLKILGFGEPHARAGRKEARHVVLRMLRW